MIVRLMPYRGNSAPCRAEVSIPSEAGEVKHYKNKVENEHINA